MLKSQSEFIKIQPFIQSLRPSVYQTKENCTHEYSQHDTQMLGVDKNQRTCRKSLSKSKTLVFKRKTSINMGHEILTNKWFFNNGQLDICFNKILTKNGSFSQLKTQRHIPRHSDAININTIEILILFTKYETENFQKGSQKKVKMTIRPTQISIQDQTKVKRSFTIDLEQKMDHKNCLRIMVSQQFKPQNVFLNGKLLCCQFNQNDLPSEKICVLSPWQLINEQKALLQDKILSERPKSKIKWNSQFKENEQQKNTQILKNLTKRDEVQQHYDLRSPTESTSMSTLRFKSRTNLIIYPNKTQSKFFNVFGTPDKSSFGSTSMSSTFQSVNNSDQKPKSSFFTSETQRKTLNTQPLKFRDQRRLRHKDIDENPSLTVRPKSSFKNLKEKNEYFQMRQSQRKKSLKKDFNYLVMNNQPKSNQKMSPKSSEIKAEYGL